jgi:hypothetical protein
VHSSPKPEKWRLPELFIVASVLGGVAVCSSILLLCLALNSHHPHSVFQR